MGVGEVCVRYQLTTGHHAKSAIRLKKGQAVVLEHEIGVATMRFDLGGHGRWLPLCLDVYNP